MLPTFIVSFIMITEKSEEVLHPYYDHYLPIFFVRDTRGYARNFNARKIMDVISRHVSDVTVATIAHDRSLCDKFTARHVASTNSS